MVGAHLLYSSILAACVKCHDVYQSALKILLLERHFKNWSKPRKIAHVRIACKSLMVVEKVCEKASREAARARRRLVEDHVVRIEAKEMNCVPYEANLELLGGSLLRVTMQHAVNGIKQLGLIERDMSMAYLMGHSPKWRREHKTLLIPEDRWIEYSRHLDLFVSPEDTVAEAERHLQVIEEYVRLGELVFKARKTSSLKTLKLLDSL